MAEPTNPNETEVSSNPAGAVITTKRETTDVLDSNGKAIGGGDSALSKIFDKIEEGADAKDAIKSVMKKVSAPAKTEEVKETENKTGAEPEKKTESIKEEVKKEEPVKSDEKRHEEEVKDEDLQVLPHDKPKTAIRINALLARKKVAEDMAANTQKDLDAKAAKLAELELELGKIKSVDPLANEKVKESLDELAMYRRRYELENSDEVKNKFDGKVKDSEDTIQKTLLHHGLPEGLVKEIQSEGGWLKFVDSERPISLANGKRPTAAELAETIKKSLPVSERRRLEALELEQIQAAREKQTYFNEETKKAKDYFANKDNLSKQQLESQKANFDATVKIVKEWKEKYQKENDFLHEKSMTATTTAAEKAAIEDHNKHAKQLNQILDKRLAAKDVGEMLEVLSDSIKYHQERRNLAGVLADNKKLQDQLKAKQEELDKFKKAGGTTARSGSLASSGSRSEETTKEKAPPSLEDAFSRIEEGKSVDS